MLGPRYKEKPTGEIRLVYPLPHCGFIVFWEPQEVIKDCKGRGSVLEELEENSVLSMDH